MKKKVITKLAVVTLFCSSMLILLIPYLLRLVSNLFYLPGEIWYSQSNDVYTKFVQELPQYLQPLSSWILGIVSILLLYLLIRKHDKSPLHASYIVFIWSTSFGFLYTVYVDIISLLAVAIALFLLLLINREKYILAYCLGILYTYFYPMYGIALFLLLFSYGAFLQKQVRTLFYVTATGLFLTILFMFRQPFYIFEWSLLLQEWGAQGGISIISFCIAIIGAIMNWNRSLKFTYIGLLLLTIGAFFVREWIAFVILVMMVMTGVTLLQYIHKDWVSPFAKQIFVYAAIVALIISSATGIYTIINVAPTNDYIDGYEYLSILHEGKVLSEKSHGAYIASIGKHKPFITAASPPGLIKEADNIFYSIRLQNATTLLKQYEISYIFVTKEMMEGQVWQKSDEGLLLLLGNRQIFSKVYEDEHVQIFEVLGI